MAALGTAQLLSPARAGRPTNESKGSSNQFVFKKPTIEIDEMDEEEDYDKMETFEVIENELNRQNP